MADYVKGEKPRDLEAAKGGASLGRTRCFLKEGDGADQTYNGNEPYANPDSALQDYGKDKNYGKRGGPHSTENMGDGVMPEPPKRQGETKVLKTVRPRS